jgi:SAM-dependent methyltransferase
VTRSASLTSKAGPHVRARRGGFSVDLRRKLGGIIPNEIILYELEEFLRRHYEHGAKSLLDVGAGARPYAPVYEPFFERCLSVDLPISPYDIGAVDALAAADNLPFPDESIDCVVCTEVLEHCPDPAAALRETSRVLKQGGRAFVTTPFLVAEHDMPHDYYRYTPSALRLLAAGAGLSVVAIRPRGEYIAVALGTLLLPWAKLWQVAGSRLHADLYHPYNPLVFVPVVLPQLAYVALWKRMRRSDTGLLRRAHDKLSYMTLGYVTTLVKQPSGSGASLSEGAGA